MPLILIAFYLSILTFYTGVLIYALPIPIPGLKKWGPRLINDAFFVAIISTTIDSIIGFADYLRYMLGGSWLYYMNLVKGLILYRSMTITFLSIVKEYVSKIVPGIAKMLSIGINICVASLYSLLLMYIIALLVYYNIGTLTSLGITLMAIPFRIARNAGAFLIAFSLVFYLALPLFPKFVLFLASPQTPLDIVVIHGDIVTDLGYKVSEGYVGLEVDNEYIGPAKLFPNGHMVLIVEKKYIEKQSTLYFDVSSHRFYTNLTKIVLAKLCTHQFVLNTCKVNVSVKGLIYYSKGIAIHMAPQPTYLNMINIENNVISFKIYLQNDGELYISIVDRYKVASVSIDNSTIINDIEKYKAYSWVWYNVPGNTYVVKVSAGLHTIALDIKLVSEGNVEPETDHLYPVNMYKTDLTSVSRIVDNIIYSLYLEIVSSIIYLSLLMSISYGLTKLIGGTTKLRLIP